MSNTVMPAKRYVPQPEQRRAADPEQSVWVGASAGSGKTQVLTDRLMRLLLTGVEPASILCVTFTKAGASEMSARLFQRLAHWATAAEKDLVQSLQDLVGQPPTPAEQKRARTLFARALETPGGLKIQTIHAFCERLLQLFPLEAGLVPGFRVLDDGETSLLMREAITRSLADMDEDVAEGWNFLAEGDLTSLDALQGTMSELLSGQGGIRAALKTAGGVTQVFKSLADDLGIDPTTSEDDCFAQAEAIDEAMYLAWAHQIDASSECKKTDECHLEIRRIVAAAGDTRLKLLRAFFFKKDGDKLKHPVRKLLANAAGIADLLDQEQDRLFGLFENAAGHRIYNATITVYGAAADVLRQVEVLKRRRGVYDFDDLISRTLDLLTGSVQRQWILYKLDAGLKHVLVDEAQDTSPAQWQIVMALIEEFFAGKGDDRHSVRTAFVVGDRKQSIFSFQGADLRAFEKARNDVKAKVNQVGRLDEVNLGVSYRSLDMVLRGVDTVFAPGAPAREGFGAAGADEPRHTHVRKDGPGLVEVWPIVPKPDDQDPAYWKAPVDTPPTDQPRRVLARQIADAIQHWIGRRLLPEKTETVQPGDIMILVQRRNELFSALIAELRRRNVPVAGADRLDLNDSIIVADLMMLLQWLTLPGDDHALACVLKSPLVPDPVDEDRLFALAHGRGTESLWQRLTASDIETANAKRLSAYRELVPAHGPFGVLARVTQLCRKAIAQRLGSEAEDAMREVLELALDYERSETPSLSGFAHWFSASEHVIKREMDAKAGEVRILTVHGAKGLEAPIVFLADAGEVGGGQQRGQLLKVPLGFRAEGLPVFLPQLERTPDIIASWKEAEKERQHQERLRLLYVGMTRARDALYICGADVRNNSGKPHWWQLVSEAFGNAALEMEDAVLPDGRTVRRLGEVPRFVDDVQVKEDHVTRDIPDWAVPEAELPPTDHAHHYLPRRDTAFDSEAADRGIAIHRFLELAPGHPSDARFRLAQRLGLDTETATALARVLDHPDHQVFFGPESEAEVWISIPGRGLGRIDRVAHQAGTIHLLDFKTGRPEPLTARHAFVRQMAGYAMVMGEAYPGMDVRAALLWTQSGELVTIPHDLLVTASLDGTDTRA